jgi:hypothetical protein
MNGAGLQIPSNLGLGRSQEDAAHATWDSYDNVIMELSLKGIDPGGKPNFPRPIIDPSQYSDLEGVNYSTVMGQVDRWFEYMRSSQAEIEGRLIAVRNEMDIIGVDLRSDVRRQVEANTMKKPTEAELKDRVKEQPRYRELMRYEQDLEIAQKQVCAIVESLERYAKGLSRQITIRGQDIELGGMENGRRPPRSAR